MQPWAIKVIVNRCFFNKLYYDIKKKRLFWYFISYYIRHFAKTCGTKIYSSNVKSDWFSVCIYQFVDYWFITYILFLVFCRLERFLEKARSVLDYFGPYLGRIEIMGSSNKIERVYFEIKQSHIDQWEKPQIKESKRSFLHSVVNEGGDKEKLESFVNFCEDTIFEVSNVL